jgi:DNA helicase-2/ATP-dependent DNA helicase PcrA
MAEEVLAQLNKAQTAAVQHDGGPLLIVAGAGTGKTTVLISRLAYLIMERGIKTDEVLLLTFTEKAAGEMEERADKILPYGYVDLWINTFHGFGERILREFGLDIGLDVGFKVLTETDQWVLIKKNFTRFNLDYYRPLGNPTKFISELIRHFSRLKDENISPAEYLHYAEERESDQDARLSGGKKVKRAPAVPKKKAEDDEGGAEREIGRIKELADAYHTYNQLLLENNFLDFGDLIVYALKLFRERPNILKFYRDKFQYIMVDEFQDTNWAQYELVKLLAAPKNNLVVVGDDDQCLPGGTKVLTKAGEKKIESIKIGEEVATAVGKGCLSYSRVNHVNKVKKTASLLTFETVSGRRLTITDNHKLFCFTPRISDKAYYYVYLMFKQELGWRIGLTNDLAVRLRLERSADKIVAVAHCRTLEEARYNELLLSLKYGIPTVCFQDREGIMDQKIWQEKLYRELKVEEGVRALARDKNIDLESPLLCLAAVNRGSKTRIKINLEMCYRRRSSKVSKNGFLNSPKVLHLLSIQTSDRLTILRLEKMGFKSHDAKRGKRWRLESVDLVYLGKIARKIQKEIGGFIEPQANIGKIKEKYLKALIVPAKNIFPGLFLPIKTGAGIVYDKIISRRENKKIGFVYDLEVDRTHNFIANGITVHNSIYKFRGASLSNILQFKDDYPVAQKIVLTENYRSRQEILDYAYKFIQHNNPNRLEVKLKIDKALRAQGAINKIKRTEPAVKFFNFAAAAEEVSFVSQTVAERKAAGGEEVAWSDFAILVRANDTAEAYVKELNRRDIPNQFMSWRGLYYKPLILDILAYFRLLDNYHESAALFRVLNMEDFKVAHTDLITINKMAARKVWSLYEALKNINAISGVSAESVKNVNKLLDLVAKHSLLAATAQPTKLLLHFAYDSGLLAGLDRDRDTELFSYLNQFYQKIKKLEEAEADLRLKDFLAAVNLELEAGETGALKLDFADYDTVKVMTVHGAKGLEFRYVFLVNLVDKKFPTIARGEKIAIPDALVREKVESGADIHLEEERRLFYVAATRAKDALYLTGARDYGGAREKKSSRFIEEMGLASESGPDLALSAKNEFLRDRHYRNARELEMSRARAADDKYPLPDKFSFSQLAAYSTCPLQYKFAFILKVPIFGDKASLIFGRVMHNVLYNFLLPALSERNNLQGDLFAGLSGAGAKNAAKAADLFNGKRLMDLYSEFWQEDGYPDKKTREDYQKLGREALKKFCVAYSQGPAEIMFLEKKFSFKLGSDTIKGTIDRVDKLADGTLEIIDYKTGNSKPSLEFKDKQQLILYQLFLEEFLRIKVSALSYYYLKTGEKMTFTAAEKDITKLRSDFLKEIAGIKKREFAPKPNHEVCKYCDFREICEFRQG